MDTRLEVWSSEVLELTQVLGDAARHASWERGRDAVLSMRPLGSRDALLELQAEMAEAVSLDEQLAAPSLRGLRDVREATQAARRGVVLEPSVLLDVGQVLRVAAQTRQSLLQREVEVPRMAAWAAMLAVSSEVLHAIEVALTSEGEVRETASSRLGELRAQIRGVQSRIHARMQNVLRNPARARMLQEPYVTTRHDRSVVPVKAEYRGAFRGLVHDASASGATVFMEPYEVVELDNDLRALRIAETQEVARIVRALSERVGTVADDVAANDHVLSHLDKLMAVARWAAVHRARLVPVDADARVILRQARHPLLGGRAVPIDLALGSGATAARALAGEAAPGAPADCRIVIMTGPNTGGKTVTLKTVGLLTLLAMCGFPLPVGDGSRVGFFRGVYADIGDEQSIAQNLSTFSSHLTQIARILERADSSTLVLLDELGAGTDPREGTALAVALLEHLHEKGALVVCTTHYSELKTFAGSFDGAMNAAMEFDPQTLQPTYRVLQGVPGRSCAFEISERLGLPLTLLERARALLGSAHFSAEALVATLEVERDVIERRAADTRRLHDEVASMRARLDAELRAQEGARARALAEAADEARSLIDAARTESRRIVVEGREWLARIRLQENASVAEEKVAQDGSVSDSDALRAEEMRMREALDEAARPALEAAAEAEQVRRRLEAEEAARAAAEASDADDAVLTVGDVVFLDRYGQRATVESAGAADVQVRVGTMRLTVPRREVRKVKGASAKSRDGSDIVIRSAAGGDVERRANVPIRLDIRGYRAEDAAYEVDRYLDEVALARADQVTILHGKGAGVLLNVVQERLRAHARVEGFRPGDPGEGGWGVTVVRLR